MTCHRFLNRIRQSCLLEVSPCFLLLQRDFTASSTGQIFSHGQCSVEFLGLAVIYTTQRSCISSEPLLHILCTLFLNKIRYHDLENRVNKNLSGFKLGILASKV